MKKSQHTPGPWNVEICENGIERDIKSENLYVAVCMGMGNKEMEGDEEIETAANARLIAAAPEGLRAAEDAYFILLRAPRASAFRIASDQTRARLRDYIAAATGQDPEDVQNDFERRAGE